MCMRLAIVLIICIFLGLLSCDEDSTSPTVTSASPLASTFTYSPTLSLQQAAPFPVGLATQSGRIQHTRHTDILERDFNSITAEYEMKQQTIHTFEGQYNWQEPDALVDYADSRGIRVHGHALIWHQSTPSWLETQVETDSAFEAIIQSYIQEVVSRYGNKVASWDVVNEAFDDEGGWRNTIFRQRMGEDYIAKCFQYAHEADSSILLFYNEYGTIWNEGKLAVMMEMVDDLLLRGIPIDGVGLQMHVGYQFPALSLMKRAVDAIVERGLLVHFSEVDIRVNPDGKLTRLTEERAIAQENRLKEIVQLYQDIPADLQYGITFWGLRDNESWVINFWGNPDWPLLYTPDYDAKWAHRGFVEAFD